MIKTVQALLTYAIVLSLLTLSVMQPAAAETLTAAQAYEKGKTLHFQDKFEEAEPYLLYAGEGGYAAAYYLIANAGHFNRFAMSEREYQYIKLAAEKGHLLAQIGMISTRSHALEQEKQQWRTKFFDVVNPEINKGNPLAYELKSRLYVLTEDYFDLLSDSAYAGYPSAQWEMARRFRMGDGWFFLPGSREKEVAKLFEAAARGGYHEAIMYKGFTTISGGDIDTGMAVLTSLVDKGDAQVLSGLGIRLSGIGKEYIKSWTYFDKVKGAVLLKSLALSTSPKFDDAYQNFSDRAWATLTDEEKAQVDKLTEEYLNNHTVYKQDGLDEYEYTVDNLHTALERWGGNAIE
ncbi:hypothetical protein [Grimontia sp. NTOU-MAR1]|uniref:hypothetical protein n=1 Tax=Grimontia sp. NTOU-MAR1 TaxID=3111011 RepID=UPI002DB654DA|nr:hypothetical protein [Grimontia sp. NTOU-MAR1]WRV99288.1 hypothetical protein VP504_07790 [Grimontia sp. NTOU-MAR1]